jgi:indolepyruvate ferredoxin oxidoreductase
MGTAFRMLAKFKGLRGTRLDPFGRTAERKMERQLIRDYEKLLDEFEKSLSAESYPLAVALACLPERIRGFGHVKEHNVATIAVEREALLEKFRALSHGVEHAA